MVTFHSKVLVYQEAKSYHIPVYALWYPYKSEFFLVKSNKSPDLLSRLGFLFLALAPGNSAGRWDGYSWSKVPMTQCSWCWNPPARTDPWYLGYDGMKWILGVVPWNCGKPPWEVPRKLIIYTSGLFSISTVRWTYCMFFGVWCEMMAGIGPNYIVIY